MKRAITIELACRNGGVTQRAVAEQLGVSEHAIGKQRHRLASALSKDPTLHGQMDELQQRYAHLMSSV